MNMSAVANAIFRYLNFFNAEFKTIPPLVKKLNLS